MNATVGKYVPGNSVVHTANPIMKIIANIVMIVLIFLTNSFILNGAILVITIFIFMLSGLRMRQLVKMLYTALFIGFFLFVINLFLVREGYGSIATSDGRSRVDYLDAGSGYFFDNFK